MPGVVRRLLSAVLLATLGATLFVVSPVVAQGGPPPPPVTVAAPLAQKVQMWDEYTGRFEAFEQVEVRARVSGYLDKVHFAENEVERADGLVRNQTITARDVDQRRANLAVARAQLLAADANERTAALNLEWTEVRASIDGRISDKRSDVGSLITGGQGATLLTTIVRLDPIHFVFDASEADYIRYTRLLASGERPSGRDAPNPVQVRLTDERDWSRTGKMDFVDNTLNPRSGTIRGRAVFDNKDTLLTPGTFGRMRLWGGDADVLLVPDNAIVSDQARKIALTVGPDNKVVPKVVTLGPIANGLRVVRTGLTREDKVVITGLANPMVRPGSVVTPQAGEIKAPSN
jgi:membrane fusion protein, multidrug efflux system